MSTDHAKGQIERIFDAFNRGAIDEIDDIFHPDYVDHGPSGDVEGRDAFKGLVQGWLGAFPDARFEIFDIVADGAMAAWRVRFTGSNTGPFMGMPATGRPVDVQSIEMGRLADDGRPIEHWSVVDMLTMMQQLGLVPAMAPAES